MTADYIQINSKTKLCHGESEKVIPTLDDNSIDLVITSPPYNVNLGDNKFNKNPYDMYNDNKDHWTYIKWLRDDIFGPIYSKLKSGGRVAINIGDGKNGRVPTHVDIIHFMTRELKYLPMATLIWRKSQVSNRCLPSKEPINTSEGYKNIEDIKIGDYVLTHKGRYKKVINTFQNNYSGYLYKIKSYSGEEIRLTKGHQLLTFPFERKCKKYSPKKCVSKNYSWIPPEDLPKEIYLGIPKYRTCYHSSSNNFIKRMVKVTGEKINYYDKDFFRLLGYYIGDGSTHRSEVRIDFNKKEIEYAKDVEDICKKYNWTFFYEKRENVLRICICSKNKLPKILESLGGKYAVNKKIHPFLFQMPFNFQKELIKGLFRSDGSINSEEAAYVTISRELAYQIRDILLRLKIGSSVNKRKNAPSIIDGRKINPANKIYVVRVYGKYVDMMASILNIKLNHNKKYRHSKIKVGSHHEFYKIRHISKEFVKNIQVYNLEVEDDNSYVGKITYHNCSWGSYQSPSSPSFPNPFEYIMLFAKDNIKLQTKGETDLTAREFQKWAFAEWSMTAETKMKKIGHPACFPVELPRRLIKMLSWTDATVLDPFNGAGTTGVACNELGRNYVGIEMSKKYCDITKHRIDNLRPKSETDMFST